MIYTVESLHFCGEGLAHGEDGSRVRIANALPCEVVEAEDVSIKRKKQAVLTRVLTPSPDRCSVRCPHWHRCGACAFQGVAYSSQCAHKRAAWVRLIQKFVSLAQVRVEFWEAPSLDHYRHRTEAQIFDTPQGLCLGIAPRLDVAVLETLKAHPEMDRMQLEASDVFDARAWEPVPLIGCMLHADALDKLMARTWAVCASHRELSGLRLGFEAQDLGARITFFVPPDRERQIAPFAEHLHEQLQTHVVFQVLPPKGSHVYPTPQVFGAPWYTYAHNDAKLEALKGAWTPVNLPNAELIRRALAQMTQGEHFERLLELGCGCGTHTTVLKKSADHLIGIDASWPAIQSAQHNAQINAWDDVQFFTDTAEHYLDKRYYKGGRADAIVMHSNRLPYSPKTAQLCKRFGAKQLFIVSPTAFAMARECQHFVALGYRLEQLILCDTLPMTYHMMAVAHLRLLS